MGHGFNSYVTNYQMVFPMNLPINRWYVYHSQSRLVYDIVLTTFNSHSW